jgi:hypothetical protein
MSRLSRARHALRAALENELTQPGSAADARQELDDVRV